MISRLIGSEVWRSSRVPDLREFGGDRDAILERKSSQTDAVIFCLIFQKIVNNCKESCVVYTNILWII